MCRVGCRSDCCWSDMQPLHLYNTLYQTALLQRDLLAIMPNLDCITLNYAVIRCNTVYYMMYYIKISTVAALEAKKDRLID